MPIGYSDIYLVLRAQNYASSTISQVSTTVRTLGDDTVTAAGKLKTLSGSLVSTGTMMAGLGLIGVRFFSNTVKAANDYGNSAAYAQTQTKGLNISLDQLKQVGLDIGTTIPLSIDQLQTGLYNIFSSTNVGLSGAKTLLKEFAKAGVAGQAELDQVSRGTLQEMNAFQVPVKDVNRLLDIQFQMVKVGVGSYTDFMYKLGNIVPVARAAGQSVETMSGAWAFGTRNAMGTAMAATSLSRAMEELQKPKFQEGLKKIGVSSLDSHGKLKQINVLVTDIAKNPAWQEQVRKSGSISAAYTTLFGTGTIQARRFFNVAIPNYEQLNTMIDQMNGSKGQMQSAYDTMFKTPVSQIELMKNNIYALKVQIGNLIGPTVVSAVHMIVGLINAFKNLNPHVRDTIVKIGAIASVFFLVFGAVAAVVGMIGMAVSGIMAFGVGAGAAIGILAGLTGALIAIPAILYLIWHYHKQIAGFFVGAWHMLRDAVKAVWGWFTHLNGVVKVVIGIFVALAAPILIVIGLIYLIIKYHNQIWHAVVGAWHAVIDVLHLVGAAFKQLIDWIMVPVNLVIGWFKETWKAMRAWWKDHWQQIHTILKFVWDGITGLIKIALVIVVGLFWVFYTVIKAIWTALWFVLKPIVQVALAIVTAVVKVAFGVIKALFTVFYGVLKAIWSTIWYVLSHVVRTVFSIIKNTVKVAFDVIVGIFSVALDLLTGHWGQAWDDIKKYVGQALEAVWNLISDAFSMILDLFGTTFTQLVSNMVSWGKQIPSALWNGIKATWSLITNFFSTIVNTITGFFNGIWDAMVEIGKNIVKGLWHGITSTWHMVKDGIKDLLGGTLKHITSFLGIASPSKKYAQIGRFMAEGLAQGLRDGKKVVRDAHNDLFPAASVGANPLNSSSVVAAAMRARSGQATVINLPKGAVSVTVNGTMNATDQKKLEEALSATLQKVLGNVGTRISATRAA